MFIGLTGGMGCGKSTACDIFTAMGWQILDADEICHSLYDEREGKLLKLLLKRWGEEIADADGNELDRGKVSDIIFNSSEERNWLNATIHPLVLQKALDIHAANLKRNMVFGVPLLFEAGWENRFEAVITVWTENEIRRRRLRGRGMSDKEILRRDAAQMSIEMKMRRADYVLINNGDIEELRAQCEIISNALRNT